MGQTSGTAAPEGKADALLFPKHNRNVLPNRTGAILPFMPLEHQDNLFGHSVSSHTNFVS
jgi:hypothetical protein